MSSQTEAPGQRSHAGKLDLQHTQNTCAYNMASRWVSRRMSFRESPGEPGVVSRHPLQRVWFLGLEHGWTNGRLSKLPASRGTDAASWRILKKNWRRTWPMLILVRKASILLYLEWYWHSYGYESTKKKVYGHEITTNDGEISPFICVIIALKIWYIHTIKTIKRNKLIICLVLWSRISHIKKSVTCKIKSVINFYILRHKNMLYSRPQNDKN